MTKKVFIYGIGGNMGARYRAILDHLGAAVYGYDVKSGEDFTLSKAAGMDGIIIATPTENHLRDIETFLPLGIPILCEKPFTKSIEALENFEHKNEDNLHLVRMVNQYEFLKPAFSMGCSSCKTTYDYFKTGGDGLAWDCINIIGLSHGVTELSNTSPIWKCKINGVKINIKNMDYAYIKMISKWLSSPNSNFDYAKKAHYKVASFIEDSKYDY